MDTRDWFDKAAYSDLTIKLSHGAEVKVHKVILCQANEYFRKLCGPESHFAESKQTTIELKEDDRNALYHVLRHIYKLPFAFDPPHTINWRAMLSLRTTADKYLEPELSALADETFRRIALGSTKSDEIFDIIETINNEMSYDESLVEFGAKLRQDNIGKLLKNDRFRTQLDDGGKETLWQVLDDLVFAADLVNKRYHLCETHKKDVFQEPSLVANEKTSAKCTVCECVESSCYAIDNRDHQGRTAWVTK